MSDKKVSPQRGTNPITRDINAAQRVTLAIRLRASKMTYEAIAHKVGYANASACRKAVMRELDRCIVKNVEALRLEECAMLDELQQECYTRLKDKNFDKAMLFAVDRLLTISERRAKLLGLDKRPDEELADQHYRKEIILIDEPGQEAKA